mgnify:CR=1 FL=1
MVNYSQYLTKDYKLNFKKLYRNMSNISGFRKEQSRMKLYNEVVSWYNDTLKTQDEEYYLDMDKTNTS